LNRRARRPPNAVLRIKQNAQAIHQHQRRGPAVKILPASDRRPVDCHILTSRGLIRSSRKDKIQRMKSRCLCPLLLGVALVLSATSAFASSDPKSSLPFIRDDYPKALAEAKARKLPLFVEVWAPWCHSCRSMAAYVFPDPALRKYAPKFIWAAVDIEKPENATFRKDFVVEGFPTLYIVDPTDGKVALRWLGGATVDQLRRLLDDGARAVSAKGEDQVRQSLAKADRLYGEGRIEESVAAYEETLKLAPKGWNRHGRTVESLLFALQSSKRFEQCAETALAEYPKLRNTSSAMNLTAVGLDCAVSLPKENPKRVAAITALEKSARETMDNSKVIATGDDRSGLYLTMISAREDAGDKQAVKALTVEWSAFLDQAAARARTPDARAVFDAHRLSAYLELGQPERAVPMLAASEKDLPDDYNPPARLAAAYRATKQYDLALAAADRALAKAYGPRKLLIYRTKADVLVAMGNNDGAKATMQEAITVASSLPDGQRNERTITSLQEKLKSLDQAAAP
jgi:thioredoxin-like negative regulator of GroEL